MRLVLRWINSLRVALAFRRVVLLMLLSMTLLFCPGMACLQAARKGLIVPPGRKGVINQRVIVEQWVDDENGQPVLIEVELPVGTETQTPIEADRQTVIKNNKVGDANTPPKP
jgi:hypothetical protein